jgi:beta-glucosidase
VDRRFPDSFWWGTAASSPQTEGAAPASDWLEWERLGKVPPSGDGNGFAERYAEDFRLYAKYGLSHHRLGLEWARIEPEEGRRDNTAIERYRLILEAASDAGIAPWVCLHHFVLPTWVADDGRGFVDERARNYYWRRHVEFVAETFGDLVFGWKPINEPVAYAVNGFLSGVHSPGMSDIAAAAEALEGAHLADLTAWRVLRSTGKPVSTIHALPLLFPADESPEAAEATKLLDDFAWGSWVRAIQEGVLQLPGRPALELPDFRDAFDMVGFSYYFCSAVSGSMELGPYPAAGKTGPIGYVPWAEGLGLVLDRIATELPQKPVLICEIGVGTEDDAWRCEILEDSLQIVADRVAKGMDIRGVFHWTGVDNYEWSHAFTVPFGLFDTARVARPSAELFHRVATNGRLDSVAGSAPSTP